MKNKHVLFLTPFFCPHVGGVEKHVYEIGKELTKRGYLISILTQKHTRNLKSFQKIEKMNIFRMPCYSNNKLKKFKIWLWMLKHIHFVQKADIIHCHDVFFWYFPFRFLFLQKKVFTTFHGYESYTISKKAIIIRKLSEKLSKGNICIGQFIEKWYGTKADYILYGGVNPARSSNSKLNNKSAVFIGRLDEQTGIKTYIDAFEQIRKKVSDFKITVIGDGKFKNFIGKRTKVIGWMKNPKKYLHIHRFAFVSRYLSILEAMIVKRLVFAVFDNPVKKDYLFMTPFNKYIVITSDAKELSEKVIYYLKHPKEEKKLIDKSFEFAKKQTWEKVVNTYVGLWEK